MSKKYTEKSRFQSAYSPGKYVTDAQYVVEKICEKNAKSQGRDLPQQFWQLPEWEKFFRQQIPTANKLLQKYHVNSILAALKDKRMWKCYSLRSPFLAKVIEEKQAELVTKAEKNKTEEKQEGATHNIYTKPKQARGKKNIISALKDLDGDLDGEEES